MRFHLSYPRDGGPVACSCVMRRDHDEGDEPLVEHAVMMSSGSMQIRPKDVETEEVYPLDRWMDAQRHHHKVYTRTVIVIEDWHEVPE